MNIIEDRNIQQPSTHLSIQFKELPLLDKIKIATAYIFMAIGAAAFVLSILMIPPLGLFSLGVAGYVASAASVLGGIMVITTGKDLIKTVKATCDALKCVQDNIGNIEHLRKAFCEGSATLQERSDASYAFETLTSAFERAHNLGVVFEEGYQIEAENKAYGLTHVLPANPPELMLAITLKQVKQKVNRGDNALALPLTRALLEALDFAQGDKTKFVWAYYQALRDEAPHVDDIDLGQVQRLVYALAERLENEYEVEFDLEPTLTKLFETTHGVGPGERNPLIGWAAKFDRTFPQGDPGYPEAMQSRITGPELQGAFSNEEKELLLPYLQKLKETCDELSDRKDLSKDRIKAAIENITLRAERMIQLACKNPEFKRVMFEQIEDGLRDCGDRALVTFNEIEIQWQLQHKELTLAEFKALAIRIGRYEILKKYADDARFAHLGDKVEIILGFHLALRDEFQLPITLKEMLYPRASGIDQNALKSAKRMLRGYSDEQLLAHSEPWKARMAELYPQQAEERNEKYGDWFQIAEEYDFVNKQFRSAGPVDSTLERILRGCTQYDDAAKSISAKRGEALAGLYRM